MENNFFINLIDNIALLLALGVINIAIPFKFRSSAKQLTLKDTAVQAAVGVIVGIVGVATMLNPLEVLPGIIIDVRSVLMVISGLMFGLIPTIISCVFVCVFRVVQGGVGVLPGVTFAVASAIIGLVWRRFRYGKIVRRRKWRWLELYVMGVITHILVISSSFMLPFNMAIEVIERVGVIIIAVLPVVTVLIGLLLLTQVDHGITLIALEESEGRLKTTLLSVGDGVFATDNEGKVTLINEQAQKMTGYSKREAAGRPLCEVLQLVDENTHEPLQNPVERVMTTGGIGTLPGDASLVRKDGTRLPVSDSAAPIVDAGGEMHGAIMVVRDATEERRRLEEINFLAFHDTLTGLYNRRFFDEELHRLDTRRNLPMSIVVGDVNGLKLTNDAFGHAKGDELLQRMADALKSVCRADDIVARWGGDEFIMLLPKTDAADAERICRRIRQNCASVKVAQIKFSISLGHDTKVSEEEQIDEIIKSAEDYMYRQKSTESLSVRSNTINTILRTLHEKSPWEKQHSERVSSLCKKVGQVMGMSAKEASELALAGLMHDIGKIAINADLLNKNGPLEPKEWEEAKRHSEIGYRILSASNNMAYIAEYVLRHHERPDGRGYPGGVSGDDIPLQSRIIAVADAYDAMTRERPYRAEVSKESAAMELVKYTGEQFDDEIVRIFIDNVLPEINE